MRIGIEAQRIFRDHKHGMDFVALEMIRSLQRLDLENEYVIFVNDGPDRCLDETDNFKIVQFGGSYPIWEQFKLARAVKEHACDVLHCTSNTAPVFCPVPLVVTIHDIIYFETNPLTAGGYSLYQRFGNLYRRLVVRQNLKSARKIITVSHFERKRFEEFLDLADGQLEVVYNGVGAHFRPEKDESSLETIRSKYGLPLQYFLFLGNTDPKKNTTNTILAFAEFCESAKHEYDLVVADLDPGRIRKLLSDKGLEKHFDRIRFTGYIDNKDLPAVIQLAELFLYPSKRESFGIPILEAMGVGTPVITSNAASMPEVSGEAAFLVDPLVKGEITEALASLVNDSDKRAQMSEKGLKRAAEFSWENTAKGVLNIYQGLLN